MDTFMKLTFLGGADEVGASGTLIEIAGLRVLVDAGIRISSRTTRDIHSDQLPDLRRISEIGAPDYILVTHAHTDHTGALPLVVEQYPHVPVLLTAPTAALVRVLQADAQRIMHSRQEAEGELPLFDEVAVERLLSAFQIVDFRQPIRLSDRLQVTYYPAGHIVGAAVLALESDEGTLVMSGDVSLTPQRAVISAALPALKADALVLESTYGGKLHANRAAEEKRLIERLKLVTERGGKALIPAFALGRAQEVLQILLANMASFDVPIYVDGMVRAVCQAYGTFGDLLPKQTVSAAGDEPLFFRERVKAVQNAAQRMQIGQGETPCIIVTSSGMLTGGPSAAYAKWLAGDERNAILLTGYQDEESPGRFVQRIVAQRAEGDNAIAWRIDGETVTLRCEAGTYSLSAHADEAELVSVADALSAETIALVHGDPAARHSLASRLRERQKRVLLPHSGQTIELNFAARVWRIGAALEAGTPDRPLDVPTLWHSLTAGNYYTARELARLWWGDEARAPEIVNALEQDGVHFAADWRARSSYLVHSAEQLTTAQHRRAIMQAYPDLVGQWAALRDANRRVRLGVIQESDVDNFDALVLNAKGRHYPADALVWPFGIWQGTSDPESIRKRLQDLLFQARAVQDLVLPYTKRQALVAASEPVMPDTLIPDPLPDEIPAVIARLAIVLALADDGAILDDRGLLPTRLLPPAGPLEQNTARQLALAAFPAEAQLRKVGIEVARRRLTLTFDFPDRAATAYAEQIDQLADDSGWEVKLTQEVNQQALGAALIDLLPAGTRIVKGPSYHIGRHEVAAALSGALDRDNQNSLTAAFFDRTGFRLLLPRSAATTPVNGAMSGTTASGQSMISDPSLNQPRVEINAAYGRIKQALGEYGLYKTGLKGSQIMLSFISPQVGLRYQTIIDQLATETGYSLILSDQPNQGAILIIANRLARDAGWQLAKPPGLHINEGTVSMKLSAIVSVDSIASVDAVLQTETGYRLSIVDPEG